jgi:alkylhydroperoxidase family enzyme
MARISLDPPKTLSYRIGTRFARRRYGVMLDPGAAMAHNMKVGRSYALFELGVERWRTLDRGLKDIAVMAVAASIGCAWCLDFGYWETTMNHKVPAEKIRAVPDWRDSDVFTELERLVLEYAEAMTDTPPSVTDEMVARLSAQLSEAELVELTAIVAVENLRSRINSALGLTAQGFKDRCEIPAAGGAGAAAAAAAGLGPA